jgi:hypothetical protein
VFKSANRELRVNEMVAYQLVVLHVRGNIWVYLHLLLEGFSHGSRTKERDRWELGKVCIIILIRCGIKFVVVDHMAILESKRLCLLEILSCGIRKRIPRKHRHCHGQRLNCC